jgi:hypothetical protein
MSRSMHRAFGMVCAAAGCLALACSGESESSGGTTEPAGAGGTPGGTGGAVAGTGGAVAGTGGVLAGTGGAVAGTGGVVAGTGGVLAGTGGATGGAGGEVAGAGGTTGGTTGGTGGATGGAGGACADENANCPGWASTGECEANPGYMLVSCCASCAAGTGGTGGATGGTGGTGGGTGGATGGTGGGTGGATGGSCAGLPPLPAGGATFDCGTSGQVLENNGRPDNRVTYVILGDGYTQALLDTLFIAHIQNMLTGTDGRFSPLGEPYTRYRKFVNICALKVASNDACIDDGDSGTLCDTAFDGEGDDLSRLGTVNETKVRAVVSGLMPASIDVDWTAVTINAGATNWWNSGGSVMVWNGSFTPQARAASVALHEGGHAFHRLADEYTGTNTGAQCTNAPEVNVTTDGTGAKWAEWLGYDDTRGTGVHGAFEGARYCNNGVYRPTDNSEMNILPDYYNMPSMQKIIQDIYLIVRPFDAYTSNAGTLTNPGALQVRVVDPAVLKVEWSVDGASVTADGGECFDTGGLTAGQHTVTARAYDDTPWVRTSRANLEQTVSWTVNIQ